MTIKDTQMFECLDKSLIPHISQVKAIYDFDAEPGTGEISIRAGEVGWFGSLVFAQPNNPVYQNHIEIISEILLF